MSAPLVLHATCVALGDRAVVITGASGRGKSALGLGLMSLGCTLVADDRTELTAETSTLIARCPLALQGLIEARGVGILRADTIAHATVALSVDLDQTETDRFPPQRSVTWLNLSIPLLHKVESAHFAAAILQYLRAGRRP